MPPGARSRADALAMAHRIATAAKQDFEAAVVMGDPGSVANAGVMYRGILEPSVERALFDLEVGEVSDPIDTPRGFWVARRLE